MSIKKCFYNNVGMMDILFLYIFTSA